MIQFLATGTPAQVLAAIDAAIARQSAAVAPAWERLGIVGVTGVDLPLGVRPEFWSTGGTIDAPELLPLGRMMACANAPGVNAAPIFQSSFTLREFF